MSAEGVAELISSVGFPIVCVIGLGFFIWKYGQKLIDDNATVRTQIMQNNKEREDKLYGELREAQSINKDCVAVLSKYADRLDNIEEDIGDIKESISKQAKNL